jgi:soluble lytic murein transglycosylase-like protein
MRRTSQVENRDHYMAHLPPAKLNQISIKDRLTGLHPRLKQSRLAYVCARVPGALYASVAGFFVLCGALMVLSFSLANVVAHQGYEKVAFATPAKSARLIRQAEVAHFGNRVSDAFGVKHHVATEFADWILEASERQNLAPELLASLVVTESSFRKVARSHVGAVGPTQVRPDYWSDFCGQPDLHDPEENVYCGAQVLGHLLDRCEGDTACALAAYNVGPYAQRQAAASRYLEKIDRYMSSLTEDAL